MTHTPNTEDSKLHEVEDIHQLYLKYFKARYNLLHPDTEPSLVYKYARVAWARKKKKLIQELDRIRTLKEKA